MFKPLTFISYADLATLTSATLGFLAITYIIDGTVESYIVALLLLPISAIIDGMDGALARKFGTKHDYGKYLDSISDSICFGIAPSILVYSLYYDISRGPALDILNDDMQIEFRYNIENFVAITSSLMIALLSLFRLARFTVGDQSSNQYFEGLPSPGLTMFIVLISIKYSLINGEKYSLINGDIDNVLVPLSIGIVSLLTVSTIPYAKARAGFLKPILFGILVLLLTVVLRFFDNDLWETIWFAAFLLYMSYFVLIPALIFKGIFEE